MGLSKAGGVLDCLLNFEQEGAVYAAISFMK
jgi:hypothetical protein